ncbi:protein FAR1-RELATED SEQUENCE 5-like [Cornus florida]|uniref:protein FAR1-RELATED SEQUENCE 5-like n=1 Tax=Cornus florida TaxID=4283 RepID=UPI00289EB816|nr:protein FAR1-RELATED SEQUENCE 5-like [Cornus florida]
MPSQRKIKSVQAIDAELATDCGISVLKAFESLRQANGRKSISFIKVDVQNYIRMRRRKDLELGDVNWLMNYFKTQSLEDPSFFYAVQLDNGAMITNIFWADAKMISDYGHFLDVVTFDTTYKLVHGNWPFAVFLDLNHHRETVVFGAAFIYDETTDYFGWLFNTFLKTLSHKAPSTILTDQDTMSRLSLSSDFGEHSHEPIVTSSRQVLDYKESTHWILKQSSELKASIGV